MYPHLLQLGKFALPTYGVLAAAGLILGLMLNVRLAVRDGMDEEKSWNLGVTAILAAIIGSKMLLVIIDWQYYSSHWHSLLEASFLQSGGVYYGGLIGAIGASVIYMKWAQMPVLRTCDAFAPGVAFGHGLGRLGCLAAGCCYGKPTDLPWGITFTNQWANLAVGTPLNVRLHPSQIYEFLAEMVITFLLLLLLWRRKRFNGQVIGAYAFMYGASRFFLEFLRGDPDRGSVFGGLMTLTQLISIIFVVAGGLLWLRRQDVTSTLTSPVTI